MGLPDHLVVSTAFARSITTMTITVYTKPALCSIQRNATYKALDKQDEMVTESFRGAGLRDGPGLPAPLVVR